MTKKQENITEDKGEDINLRYCSHCKSDSVWRVQRNETEKITYYLSGGRFLVKKYVCKSCDRYTFIHTEKSENAQAETSIEANGNLTFVNCTVCNTPSLQILETTPDETKEYNTVSGKVAFKKIKCCNCNHELIISIEDFEAAVTNEL